MYLNVCICMYMYVYVCICMYMYVHVCMYVCVCMCMYVWMNEWMNVWNVWMYECVYIYICVWARSTEYVEESFETCFSCVIMFLLIVVWRTLNPKTYRLIVMFFPLKTRHRAWWSHCSCGASTVQLLQRSRPKKLLCITRVWGYPILTNN